MNGRGEAIIRGLHAVLYDMLQFEAIAFDW